jgi:hypothetical protein
MKIKLLFVLMAFFFTANLFAQDVIVLTNAQRIDAIVLEIGINEVKYVKANNPNGPTFLVPKTDINCIIYANGDIDTFNEEKKATSQKNTTAKTQNSYEKEFKNILRFKPAATFASLALGLGEIDLQYVRYVHPKIGIPVEVDLAFGDGGFGIGIMSGIETVPITHRQKSGLFMNLLVGGMVMTDGYEGVLTFCGYSHIGYNLCTRKGFVFTPAIGVGYNGITGFVLSFMLDIGFAF